ncbi:histidine acid phosphatase, partial [Ostertagia ostertagi]
VWRHGDRSPTKTFPTDPFQDGNWTFGGGGFGQLSPIGMKQHMKFGEFLRKTYVDDLKFLGNRYSSKEILCSLDRQKSNDNISYVKYLGMYGQQDNNAIADLDYPSDDGWPKGFVPMLNPDAPCHRQTWLWNMAKTSPELQEFQTRPDVADLLANLTRLCGEPIDIDNLNVVRDALFIEQVHANDTLRKVNTWFSDDLYNKMTTVNDQVQIYQNGIFGELH